MTENILALDVATKTGYCTNKSSGTWDFKLKRDESSGMRLLKFKKAVEAICKSENITLIAFERTAGFHKAALITQAELHGALKLFCEENGINYVSYSASEIKLFATGKGNAGKPQMIEACKKRWKPNPIDDNESDAIALYHLAVYKLNL